MNPHNDARSFDRIVVRAELRRTRVHDLWHTMISVLIRTGAPMKVVQERAGHASITITMDIYGHLAPDTQDRADDVMDRLIEDAVGR